MGHVYGVLQIAAVHAASPLLDRGGSTAHPGRLIREAGPDGTLIGKHQKIMPTVGERLVHMGGFGDTFGAFQTELGPMSGLICGENSNPLAVFALTAEGTRIHVMSWPNHFPVSGDPLRDRVAIDARSFAQMSKAFVIAACGTVDERMVEMLKGGGDTETFLRDPDSCGGSC